MIFASRRIARGLIYSLCCIARTPLVVAWDAEHCDAVMEGGAWRLDRPSLFWGWASESVFSRLHRVGLPTAREGVAND